MGLVKLLAFDLDGTLVDSLGDLHSALVRTMRALGHPLPSLEATGLAIGDGAGLLVRRLLPEGCTEAEFQEAFLGFRREYNGRACEETTLYPGVREFFAVLASRPTRPRLAVLTNKPEAPAHAILKHFGLFELGVEWLVGGDTFATHKPNPEGLLWLMGQAGAKPAETAVVGDGAADQGVARAVGAEFIALESGYGNPEAFAERPADAFPGFAAFAKAWLRQN
jgi:phosphoglycolate phosphatase